MTFFKQTVIGDCFRSNISWTQWKSFLISCLRFFLSYLWVHECLIVNISTHCKVFFLHTTYISQWVWLTPFILCSIVNLINISRIVKIIDKNLKIKLVHGLVFSIIDFCNALYYGLQTILLNGLQMLITSAARIVVYTRKLIVHFSKYGLSQRNDYVIWRVKKVLGWVNKFYFVTPAKKLSLKKLLQAFEPTDRISNANWPICHWN